MEFHIDRTYEVLVQWQMAFVLLAILIVPAFIAWRQATYYNKHRWRYFIIGLAFGILAVGTIKLSMLISNYFLSKEAIVQYSILLGFIPPFIFLGVSIIIFKKIIAKRG
jgi:bacteriorhodopsin